MSTLQREAVLASLNSDARSLLNDLAADPSRHPVAQRIEDELNQCNRLFAELALASQDTGTVIAWRLYDLLYHLQ